MNFGEVNENFGKGEMAIYSGRLMKMVRKRESDNLIIFGSVNESSEKKRYLMIIFGTVDKKSEKKRK